MDKNTFELGDNDAAIIFKQDMSTEIVLPEMEDDEAISFEEHQNMFVAIAISGSMADEAFRKVISAKLDTMFKNTEKEASSCDTDDAGCPGCKGCD